MTTTETTPRRPSAKQRTNEQIGGGFFVFRRGKKTGRVGIRSQLPFEHPDYASAVREAARLAALHNGETFEVFQTTGTTVGTQGVAA